MSHFINPLLLDRSTATTGLGATSVITTTARNFARGATTPVDGVSFAQQLATVSPTAVAPAAANMPTPLTVASSNTPASTANAPTPEATAATPIDTTEAEETSGTSDIEPSRSSRLGNSGATNVVEVSDFSFDDLIDIINPLQHIPILGAMYREATGDEIKPVARVAGDMLFGAMLGGPVMSAASAVIGAVVEQHIGEDPDQIVADILFGPSNPTPPDGQAGQVMLAGTATAAPVPVAVAQTQPPAATIAPSAPVQTAIAENPITKTTAKAPYGGVMDLATAKTHPLQTPTEMAAAIAPTVTTPTGQRRAATRIGNVIYTSPTFNSAARVVPKTTPLAAAAPTSAPAATVAPVVAPNLAEAKAISSLVGAPAGLPIPGTEASSPMPTLGEMVGGTRSSNNHNQLPSNLVQDMMMMALDKYKAAGGLAPSEMRP